MRLGAFDLFFGRVWRAVQHGKTSGSGKQIGKTT